MEVLGAIGIAEILLVIESVFHTIQKFREVPKAIQRAEGECKTLKGILACLNPEDVYSSLSDKDIPTWRISERACYTALRVIEKSMQKYRADSASKFALGKYGISLIKGQHRDLEKSTSDLERSILMFMQLRSMSVRCLSPFV